MSAHWATRDFHDEVPARRRLMERGVTAAAVMAAAFAVFLLAIQHENRGCRDACYDGGLRSYEGGHAWTAYQDAWQWQAQWGIALGALVLGLAALASASRFALRRWTTGLTVASAALAVAWVAWRVLEPAIPV